MPGTEIMDIAIIVQTITVLVGVIALLAKWGMEGWRKKHGAQEPAMSLSSDAEKKIAEIGGKLVSLQDDLYSCRRKIEDLHAWHAPLKDPHTGQQRFQWYDDSGALRNKIEELQVSIDSLVAAMKEQTEALKKSHSNG